MSSTKTYRCNLRGIEVGRYKHNPIVLRSHDYTQLPIGTATILKGKTSVEITYFDEVPAWPHAIGTSTLTQNYEQPQLLELSVIPVLAAVS